jgi:hypothetical protein
VKLDPSAHVIYVYGFAFKTGCEISFGSPTLLVLDAGPSASGSAPAPLQLLPTQEKADLDLAIARNIDFFTKVLGMLAMATAWPTGVVRARAGVHWPGHAHTLNVPTQEERSETKPRQLREQQRGMAWRRSAGPLTLAGATFGGNKSRDNEIDRCCSPRASGNGR